MRRFNFNYIVVLIICEHSNFICPPLGIRGMHYVLPMSVRLSHIWFPLNNLSSPEANHLKFIHKVRDRKRRPNSISDNTALSVLELCPLICRKIPVYFSWKQGISVLWTHSSIFFYICDSLAVVHTIHWSIC